MARPPAAPPPILQHRTVLKKSKWCLLLSNVIHFVWISARLGSCTIVSVNGTLVEDKMRRFKGDCAHFRRNKCPIYTHDGASAKFSTNSYEADYSVVYS
jgi:hypothetical protein